MIDPKALLTALQKRVTLLEDDLRARCNAQAEVDAPLRKDYDSAREKGRTGLTYNGCETRFFVIRVSLFFCCRCIW